MLVLIAILLAIFLGPLGFAIASFMLFGPLVGILVSLLIIGVFGVRV